jgi:hypothetical protein
MSQLNHDGNADTHIPDEQQGSDDRQEAAQGTLVFQVGRRSSRHMTMTWRLCPRFLPAANRAPFSSTEDKVEYAIFVRGNR